MYLASYFKNSGKDGVYLAASHDGFRFEELVSPNIPVLVPQIGIERLTRDPFILRGPNGMWHMTWTTGWWERGIGYARSRDLVRWSEQRYLEVMKDEPRAVNCWAPELGYDSICGEFIVFWSSTIRGEFSKTELMGDLASDGTKLNHRIYSSSTRDFETFSPVRLFCDPGFSCIDATLLPPRKFDDSWHIFIKDETKIPMQKNIRCLPLANLQGIAGAASPPISGSYWAEGPTAVRINGKVRVYFDRYCDDRFGAVESDDLRNWEDLSNQIVFPASARHATVVEVDEEFVESIREVLQNR